MSIQPITDDELLLYHYRDGLDAAERERIAAALLTHPGLAGRLQALVAQLDAAAAIADRPVPEQTLQRWHAALEQAGASETAARAPRAAVSKQLRWTVLAAAAAVVIAFWLGTQVNNDRRDLPPTAMNQSERCECGLKWHLVSAEQQLAGLSAASGAERAALIDAVIAQNRVYTIAAERAGDQRLAGALRSFTLVLERLEQGDAASSESAAEMAQLNFELRVVQARLAAEAGTAPSASL